MRRFIAITSAFAAGMVLIVAPFVAQAAISITAKPEKIDLKVGQTGQIFVYARGGGWPGVSGISSGSCMHFDSHRYPNDILAVTRTDQSKAGDSGTVSLHVRAQNAGSCWVKFSAGEGSDERSLKVNIFVSP
jgi:hypothetical protein